MEEQERKYEYNFQIKNQILRTYSKLREEKRASILMDVAMIYLFFNNCINDVVDEKKFKTDDEVISFIDNELFSRFELKEENEVYELFDKTENKVVYKIRKDCLAHTLKLQDALNVKKDGSGFKGFQWSCPKDPGILEYISPLYIEMEEVYTRKFDYEWFGDDYQIRTMFTFKIGTPVVDWWESRVDEAHVYWHDDESNATIKIRQSNNIKPYNDLRLIIAFKDYILPIVRKILKEGYEN